MWVKALTDKLYNTKSITMPLPNLKSLLTGGAGKLIDSVKGVISEFHISPEEKLKAEQAINDAVNKHIEVMADIALKELESENKAVTDRWSSDMSSDSWLSKNTRPIVMLSLLGFLYVLVIFDSAIAKKFEVKPAYIDLMESLLITVVVAYFGSRGVEKFKAMHESKK